MEKRDIPVIVKVVAAVMRDAFTAAAAAITARMDGLEKRIDGIPRGERGEPGEKGLDGAPGLEGPRGEAGPIGPAGEQGPPGKDGEPGQSIVGPPGKDGASITGPQGEIGHTGKDATPEDVRPIVLSELQRAIAELPKPKDGEQGVPGQDGVDGRNGTDGAPGINGKDGRDGINGKDAEPIHPDTVALMVMQAVEKAVAAIPKPRDGENGRDAAQLDILPALNPEKSYPPRTCAVHAGGTVMALRQTTPGETINPAEWLVLMNGVAREKIDQGEDPASILIERTLTNGDVIAKSLHYPAMIYMNVWRDSGEYRKGHTVTHSNSLWHCNVDGTKARPGLPPFDDWTLCAKGVRGKDGINGKDGERGPEGKPGKDLSFT